MGAKRIQGVEVACQFCLAQQRVDLSMTQTMEQDRLAPALRARNEVMRIGLPRWQQTLAQGTDGRRTRAAVLTPRGDELASDASGHQTQPLRF